MPRFPIRFVLTALLAAWLIDLLFWNKQIGINYLIWVALILVGLVFLLVSEKIRPAWANLALAVPVLALAASAFTRLEGQTVFFGVALSLLGLMLIAATTRTGNWLFYRIGDTIKAFALLFWAATSRAPLLLQRQKKADSDAADDAPAPSAWKRFWRGVGPVLLGLVLAFPIVLLLAGLLASADPIFADRLKDVLEIFDIQRLPEYLFRAFYVLVFTYVLAGVYAHAVLPARVEARPNPLQPWFKPFLGWTEGSIILLCVDALFAFFVVIQFQYFFGGTENITTSGYTFSEYAVRGFNELVTVAVISLGLYLGLAAIARQETPTRQRMFTILSVVLLGLVLVMLVSAWQRLGLYEQAYGFTRLRTYTHIFIPWLGVLLAVTILLEVFRQRGRFALALLVVVVGFGLTFPILNVDAFIARQNINRGNLGLEFDSYYLQTLSDDAVPVMLAEYQVPDARENVRDGLGAALACRAAQQEDAGQRPWLSWNLSAARAERLLAENTSAWSQYPVRHQTVTYPFWEVKVGKTWQDCDYSRDWMD